MPIRSGQSDSRGRAWLVWDENPRKASVSRASGQLRRASAPVCSLPLLAKKLHFDPAVMASPFISTIVDSLSLLIYFRFASLFLGL